MIIALHGKKGSGKDTLAKEIMIRHPNFRRVAFADRLKEVAGMIYGPAFGLSVPEKIKEAKAELPSAPWQIEKEYMSPRELWQKLGKGLRDNVHKDTWLMPVFREIENNEAHGLNTIVTDLRYPNEVEILNNYKSTTKVVFVKINRPGLENSDQHESETLLDDFNEWEVVINNSKTPYDAYLTLNYFLGEISNGN